MGRAKIQVIWELSAKRVDNGACELTNTIHSSATPDLISALGMQGIPLEVFFAPLRPIAEAHNRQETPLFAKSIERHALKRE